jgi:hypothetical protein
LHPELGPELIAFRNIPSAGDASVRLTFDRPPVEVALSVGWVQTGEYLLL